jgi:hypothetical protein
LELVKASRIILLGVGNTEQFFCGDIKENELFQYDGEKALAALSFSEIGKNLKGTR